MTTDTERVAKALYDAHMEGKENRPPFDAISQDYRNLWMRLAGAAVKAMMGDGDHIDKSSPPSSAG